MTQRNTHGGARPGAGRKGGPSEVIRLPLPIAALARRLKSGALRAGDINEFLDILPRTKLGVPTLLLLPHAPDWRWLRDRTSSPWYRPLCLFHQATPLDWAQVLAEAANALRAPGIYWQN